MSFLFPETPRLLIRPFVMQDVPTLHRILDQTLGDGTKVEDADALAERESYVRWCILAGEWHTKLHQPPYQEQAIVLKETGALIGSVAYVPTHCPYSQLPEMNLVRTNFFTPEVGLYWVIDPQHQNKGYASEAARALIEYAFQELHLARIIAATEHTNHASQAVMRKLGMTLAVNPLPDPHWLQVVGILENTK
jgi:ribosomal-protein-alanine N-acetyltransferase